MVKIKKTGLSWNNVSAKDANSCGDRFCADEACKRLEDIILSLSSRQRKGKDSDLTTLEYFKSFPFLNC